MLKKSVLFIPLLFILTACVGDKISVTDRYLTYIDPELSFSASSAEATLGAENRLPFLFNEHGVEVTYSSSDESVAKVSETGTVTLVGAGTTTITATFAAFENWLESTASYLLKVNRAGSAISWSEASCKVTIDADNTFPTLNNPDSQRITYSSDNDAVATIDSSTGQITLVAGGSATITAKAEENAFFAAGSASYILTVAKASVAIFWTEESVTAGIFGHNVYPDLVNPAAQAVTYSSSDATVAVIDETTGEITLIAGGSTVISATAAENERYESSSAAYTLTVTKAEAGLKWSESEYATVFGEAASFPVLINPNGLDITYRSSNPSVATVSSSGEITILAGGTTAVTASSAETGQWEAASVSYTLVVEKAEAGIAWSEASWSAVIDETTTFPTLSNPNKLKVSYSSSDESVAKISSSAAVTLVGPGSATIIASTSETATHKASSVSYDLTVIKREIIKEKADLSWSAAEATLSMLGKGNLPSLNNPHGLAVTYSSNHTDIATVDSEGKITPVAAGSATITASSKETETYLAGSASFALTVTRVDPALKWSSTSSTANLGASNSYPKLTNSYKVAVTYNSSDESVAKISSSGQITLVGVGSATITASSQETPVYLASSASYTLSVKKASPTLSWSSPTGTACLDGTSSLPTLNNPYNLEITYKSSNESVATVSATGRITAVAAGSTTITATSKATDNYSSISASYTLTVTKRTVTLAFSSNTASVVLGESGTYPTLTISPANAGLSVTYSSSNSSVATVNQSSGQVTPKAAGTTVITASFAGNSTYTAASDSYTLTVSEPSTIGDEIVFSSSGDTSSEDDISNTTFTRLVTVNYSSGSATVTGTDSDFSVTVSGGQVTIRYNGSDFVAYKLTGSTSNGFFKLYSSKKQAIWLSGVSITNSSGAAINNQSGKRTFVYVEGSNSLGDGSSASYSSGSEDMKGVLFSEGQLLFSGSGSLTVNASNSAGKNGIVSDDYVRFMSGPSITVNCGQSAGNGVKANDYVRISNGTLSITTKAAMKKGIASDNYVLVDGGATTITVSGGVAYDSEAGEYKGSAGIKADNYFGMKGGKLTITNSGAGGKGINAGEYDYNANHSLSDSYISGGTLTVKTTGSESNDVSAKGIKIGWATKTGSGMNEVITGYAGNLKISNGNVSVTSSGGEALEVKANLTISGGRVYAYSGNEDAINSSNDMTISGGYVCAWSQPSDRRGDAFDANGNMYITGGLAYGVSTKELAFDANSEASKKLYVKGGTLIAVGELEHGNSISGTAYTASSMSTNTWYGLWDSKGKAVFAFKTPSVSGRTIIVYSGGNSVTLKSGVSTSSGTSIFSGNGFIPGTISGGNDVSLSTYVDSGSGPGGPGGGGGGW